MMTVRIVRLGTDRIPDEGVRIGTVRRPPRGVSKGEYSAQNWYDVWFPNLSPSTQTLKIGQSAKDETDWKTFLRKFRAEMSTPENSRTLDLLAALSHKSNFSIGCYCTDEQHCHRSVLRSLLLERNAKVE
jgi:uncharacterized protein YeaO (DUF488 family)